MLKKWNQLINKVMVVRKQNLNLIENNKMQIVSAVELTVWVVAVVEWAEDNLCKIMAQPKLNKMLYHLKEVV